MTGIKKTRGLRGKDELPAQQHEDSKIGTALLGRVDHVHGKAELALRDERPTLYAADQLCGRKGSFQNSNISK